MMPVKTTIKHYVVKLSPGGSLGNVNIVSSSVTWLNKNPCNSS